MRQIGTLPNRELADNFADYLLSIGISAHVDEHELEYNIWIRNEDQIEQSRRELALFTADSSNDKFTSAVAEVRRLREEAQLAQPVADTKRPEPRRPLTARAPVLATILGLSLFVFLASFGPLGMVTEGKQLLRGESTVERSLLICDASRTTDPAWDKDGLVDVRRGQLWRLVTPAFVHFGVPHIIFNLYVLYMWGSTVEERHGSVLMLILFLTTTVTGNFSEYLISREVYVGGMSGFAFGLFGYIWIRMYVAPDDGLGHHIQTIFLMMLLLTLGFTGVLDRMIGENVKVANWVHLFGMLSGMAVAFVQHKIQPQQPTEKTVESLES